VQVSNSSRDTINRFLNTYPMRLPPSLQQLMGRHPIVHTLPQPGCCANWSHGYVEVDDFQVAAPADAVSRPRHPRDVTRPTLHVTDSFPSAGLHARKYAKNPASVSGGRHRSAIVLVYTVSDATDMNSTNDNCALGRHGQTAFATRIFSQMTCVPLTQADAATGYYYTLGTINETHVINFTVSTAPDCGVCELCQATVGFGLCHNSTWLGDSVLIAPDVADSIGGGAAIVDDNTTATLVLWTSTPMCDTDHGDATLTSLDYTVKCTLMGDPSSGQYYHLVTENDWINGSAYCDDPMCAQCALQVAADQRLKGSEACTTARLDINATGSFTAIPSASLRVLRPVIPFSLPRATIIGIAIGAALELIVVVYLILHVAAHKGYITHPHIVIATAFHRGTDRVSTAARWVGGGVAYGGRCARDGVIVGGRWVAEKGYYGVGAVVGVGSAAKWRLRALMRRGRPGKGYQLLHMINPVYAYDADSDPAPKADSVTKRKFIAPPPYPSHVRWTALAAVVLCWAVTAAHVINWILNNPFTKFTDEMFNQVCFHVVSPCMDMTCRNARIPEKRSGSASLCVLLASLFPPSFFTLVFFCCIQILAKFLYDFLSPLLLQI